MAPTQPQTKVRKPPRSWDALTPPLAQWILDYLSSMGFTQPTPVQKSCLELFRGNKDVVVEAVTGSGKTLAFLIPVIEKLLRGEEPAKRNHVQGIIISPTRELATQIYNVATTILKFHEPSAEAMSHAKSDEKRPTATQPVVVPQLLVGGTTKAAEDLGTFLRLSPNLLIGTPGRLAELLSSAYVKAPASTFEVLIMDEADRLLDMGFANELNRILGYLPKQRRTGLFSASLSDAVERLITMSYLVTPASQKMAAVVQLLEKLEPRPQRSIIFFSSCMAVKYFSRVLGAVLPAGFSCTSLHGKLEPKVREKNYERFVNTTSPMVLLTTDLAARGLDIPQVDLVIQHDPPTDTKVFIHRCGRAGRAGRRGLAVVLLQPGREEGYVQLLEPAIAVTSEEAERVSAAFRAQALADREIFQMAQLAFVSWTRSYIEHQASSIFRIADLDWVELAKGYGLLELPKMPEVREAKIDRSLGLGINTEEIPFKDKVREKKRQEELAKWKEEKAKRAQEETGDKRKKNEAWSGKTEQEETKLQRREKKRRKREAKKFSEMTEKEKEEHLKLEEMIEKVRKQNEAKAAEERAAALAANPPKPKAPPKKLDGDSSDEEFGGFDD
ncbi:unnamed protein product [Sordaria macrospora k-hell]|uniref:ATP-dependent RNA helicase n=1 Tax=Sordaria macrospora (strain ATCC MYA-333 / DSM 997 / K(L3346) / K-hell) TaxID=771870 RepID=F7W9X9_SORMK|nr:uncharacterized protein SMAC_08255 [Sordaria macrospora k-hell]CCC05246.1 unnamed protein product [Sordaria macrospora k-hell]